MPVYEYECKGGHRFERVVQMKQMEGEPKGLVPCEGKNQRATLLGSVRKCRFKAELVPSRTGTPILRRGIGGFYKPNAN